MNRSRNRLRLAGGVGLLLLLVSFEVSRQGSAQSAAPDPVQWSLELKQVSVKPGGRILGTLTAVIEPGWHLYSLTTPKGGPNPTTLTFADNPVIASVQVFQPKPDRQMDSAFKVETEVFEKQLPLLIEITTKPNAASGSTDLEAQVRYQACQKTLCLPPRKKNASASLEINHSAKSEPIKIAVGYTEVPQQH